jgi:sugar (pentulose or hexulose) kinase
VFADLNLLHGPAHLARALIEAAAFDVARAVELVAPNAASLALAGGGATDETWSNVLSAATGRVLVLRRHTDAASVGARLIAARSAG